MEDRDIVALFWQRSADAVPCAQERYGGMLMRLARSLLRVIEDAEECLNDTWLAAWGAMPTDRPECLGAYLAKITRRICTDRFRYHHAQKRSGVTLAIDELAECLPSREDVFDALEENRLREVINRFLAEQAPEKRHLFLLRYFCGSSITEIASQTGMSESNVKTTLHRIRAALKTELEREELL